MCSNKSLALAIGHPLDACQAKMCLLCSHIGKSMTRSQDMPARAAVVKRALPAERSVGQINSKVAKVANKLSVPLLEIIADADEGGLFSMEWSPSTPRHLEPVARRAAKRDDIALVLHTSGTWVESGRLDFL